MTDKQMLLTAVAIEGGVLAAVVIAILLRQ